MSDFTKRFRAALASGEILVKADQDSDTLTTFARSVAAGLSDEPRWLHCRFLYDSEGSRLFEAITQQPEYYPTNIEASILADCSAEIRVITGPRTLVELGSGYSVKTEYLLAAYSNGGAPLRYVPVDVSENALLEAHKSVSLNFPHVRFTGINGAYTNAFRVLRQLSPQMVVFLGSTIGNFNEAEATAFWQSVAGHLPPGDFFLVGVDLVKDVSVLEAAYNDVAGVTARFTKNYAARLNRELGSQIDLSQIEHVATWNPKLERMEILLRFCTPQDIRIEPIRRTFRIAAGEEVLIEISRKFRLPELTSEFGRFGFEVRRTFTDDKDWFALILLERVADVVTTRALSAPTSR
ncbi:MAG: L-histidine N(alpha)-methyltransferase [Gemmatimonadales bacterium]|jgi:L-histidine N-alpha-methyltransferase